MLALAHLDAGHQWSRSPVTKIGSGGKVVTVARERHRQRRSEVITSGDSGGVTEALNLLLR